MVSTARTVLRGFLLVGGLALVVVGVTEGSTVDVAVGGVSAVLGALGLWLAHRGWRPGEGRTDADENSNR